MIVRLTKAATEDLTSIKSHLVRHADIDVAESVRERIAMTVAVHRHDDVTLDRRRKRHARSASDLAGKP